MKGVSESLAGRAEIVEMEGVSIQETMAAGLCKYRHPSDWSDWIYRGGYPELWADSSIDVYSFYRSLTSAYLERDVRQVLQVGNLRDFERFIRLCALRTGQMLNKAELAGYRNKTAHRQQLAVGS